MLRNEESPFCLREHDNTRGWYCIVAGKLFGPWPDKGTATAGFETEKRRAQAKADHEVNFQYHRLGVD